MKRLVLLVATILLLGTYTFAQTCEWVYDSEKSYKIPVGKCTVEDLKQGEFRSTMVQNTLDFTLNAKATVALAKVLEENGTQYQIDIYFGAWDDASLLQLPRFILFERTMEAKYQQPIQCNYYACDREYNCRQTGFSPNTIPSFIVYKVSKNGERTQIGLIEEAPKQSFEDDILNMIKH